MWRTGVIGGRPFAAHFVQAVTFRAASSSQLWTNSPASKWARRSIYRGFADHRTSADGPFCRLWQAIKGHHVSNDGAHHIRDGGQPGTLIMGLSVMTLSIGVPASDWAARPARSPRTRRFPSDNRAGSGSGTFEFLNKRSTLLIQNIPCSPSGGLPSTARIICHCIA